MATPAIELPRIFQPNPEMEVAAATKSKTHWIYHPYALIPNTGPAPGLRSLLGYGEQRWTEFKRCTPYPLGNIIWQEVDLKEVAEDTSSTGMLRPSTLPMIEHVKYAQDQAAELGTMYGDTHGLRVLTPLTGIDADPEGMELVSDIFMIVQPVQYALHEMLHEFSTGYQSRLAQSQYNRDARVRGLVIETAKVLFDGARIAILAAQRSYDELIKMMSDKAVGQPGLSNASPHHVWVCEQLNKPVPAQIDKTQQGSGGPDSGFYKFMMERDAEREERLRKLESQFTPAPATETV